MYHIIVNPVAGQGSASSMLARLAELFKTHGKAFTPLTTQSPLHARALAANACSEHSEGIIAIGGDGTLQEIVSGLMLAGEDGLPLPPLGIMPGGSGNDFMLTLNAQKKDKSMDLDPFFSYILQQKTRSVDIIRAGDMAFLNIANIGLDARIVHNAVSLKKVFKRNAYLVSAFKSILQHTNTALTVEIDGETIKGSYTLVAICNGQYYGGGMRIAPRAEINDGWITVCLINSLSRLRALTLFPTVLIEKHTRLRAVRYAQCKQLRIAWSGMEMVCLDGNLYDQSGLIEFSIMPGAVRLFG